MIETGDWEEEEGVMKVIGKKDHKQAEALLDRMEDRVNRLKELNERLTKNLGAKETVEKTIHFSSLSNIELLKLLKQGLEEMSLILDGWEQAMLDIKAREEVVEYLLGNKDSQMVEKEFETIEKTL